ncbi:MAG: HAD family hydrolase [Anaerolineales bacterium]|nr:HAD family hydrolase [Anaerolineales bacterium]
MFPTVTTILFDLDGTLRHNEPTGFETFIAYLTELGCVLTPAQTAHAERWMHYYWSIAPEMKTDIEELGADTPEFWRRHAQRQVAAFELNDARGQTLADQVNQLFIERYRPLNRVAADVRPTLEGLRAAGYTVGLVSNRSQPLGPIAAEIGLADLFHVTLAAGEIGSFKPDPQIFLKAVDLAGCAPAQAAYVGDNFYADIEGARGAGLQPVLIDPRGLFPDPGCPVLTTIGDLAGLLGL